MLGSPELQDKDSEEECERVPAAPATARGASQGRDANSFPRNYGPSRERPRSRTETRDARGAGSLAPGIPGRRPQTRPPSCTALPFTDLLRIGQVTSVEFPWGSVKSVPAPPLGWSRLSWNPGTSLWPPVSLSLRPGLGARRAHANISTH